MHYFAFQLSFLYYLKLLDIRQTEGHNQDIQTT